MNSSLESVTVSHLGELYGDVCLLTEFFVNTGRLVLKKTFSAWVSTLNTGLINKRGYGMFDAWGMWCFADVSNVSPSSEQTEFLNFL